MHECAKKEREVAGLENWKNPGTMETLDSTYTPKNMSKWATVK